MVKRGLGITVIELLVCIMAGGDLLIRINELLFAQQQKPTVLEYILVNVVFLLAIGVIVILYNQYKNKDDDENVKSKKSGGKKK